LDQDFVQKAFLLPLLRRPGDPHRLENTRNGRTIATHLGTAFESKSRRDGLLGRDGLAPGEALIIAPSNAVHTFFMRFSIDVLFVRKDGQVVGLRHAVRPWRIAVSPRAYAVIELEAGTLAATDTRAGDVVALREVEKGAISA
jgi:hypothetical protein